MRLRSWLFVPGDDERKLARAAGVDADVLILDLEDAVAASAKAVARGRVREFVAARSVRAGTRLFVRINPFDGPEAVADLDAVMAARPDGIVQPKVRSPSDVLGLGAALARLESQHELAGGSTRILPIATETPEALFTLGGYAACGPRLCGLTWGAEDLATAVGAMTHTGDDGVWTAPFQLARSLCLFGAAAAGVAAIDTLQANFRDTGALQASCAAAVRDGFSGKLAIHPDQVAVINAGFTPSAEQLAHARRVVALFRDHPGAAALSLEGRMLDRPHLVQAERILARAGEAASGLAPER